jgi:hypothetical protein
LLHKQRKQRITLPNHAHYLGGGQEFFWVISVKTGLELKLMINLATCLERRETNNKLSGEIKVKYTDHIWKSRIPFSMYNAHEIFNLGARTKESIEDSCNTEKNRGYHYTHAYTYNWNAMQGFH